jgi:hypothetical protein
MALAQPARALTRGNLAISMETFVTGGSRKVSHQQSGSGDRRVDSNQAKMAAVTRACLRRQTVLSEDCRGSERTALDAGRLRQLPWTGLQNAPCQHRGKIDDHHEYTCGNEHRIDWHR